MKAQGLADKAWSSMGGGDNSTDTGDLPPDDAGTNEELVAQMGKLSAALKAGDDEAAAKAFEGAMEACG